VPVRIRSRWINRCLPHPVCFLQQGLGARPVFVSGTKVCEWGSVLYSSSRLACGTGNGMTALATARGSRSSSFGQLATGGTSRHGNTCASRFASASSSLSPTTTHGSTKEFWPTDRVFDDLRMLQVVALVWLPKAETVVGHRHHSMRAAPTRPERSLPDEESSRPSAHRADLARSRLVRPLRPAGHPFSD
jgi:hypothetical protein